MGSYSNATKSWKREVKEIFKENLFENDEYAVGFDWTLEEWLVGYQVGQAETLATALLIRQNIKSQIIYISM